VGCVGFLRPTDFYCISPLLWVAYRALGWGVGESGYFVAFSIGRLWVVLELRFAFFGMGDII
jgi:hypothetical protein